jgi:hypothetical protein
VPETKLGVAEMDDVAVFKEASGQALAVDERAVGAVQIAKLISPAGDLDHGVFFGDLAGIDRMVGRFGPAEDEGHLPQGRAFSRSTGLWVAFQVDGGKRLLRGGGPHVGYFGQWAARRQSGGVGGALLISGKGPAGPLAGSEYAKHFTMQS